MRVTLTGGSGNLGGALIERLVTRGDDVTVLDIREPPRSDVRFVRCDLGRSAADPDAIARADVVVHAAAWHGIHEHIVDRGDYWRLNVDGTFGVLEAATRGASTVVFLSSTAVRTSSFYGLTKRIGENLCAQYVDADGARIAVIRAGNFTPWAPADRLNGYGARLLYDGVDRADVVQCVELAIDWAAGTTAGDMIVLDAVRNDHFSAEDIADWESDPPAVAERLFGEGIAQLVASGLDIAQRPIPTYPGLATVALGYRPEHHFATFVSTLAAKSPADVRDEGA